MTDESTIEVDASNLSDGVIEDLVDEGSLDKKEAEEFGENVWFDEVEMREPEKTGLREYLSNQVEAASEVASRLNTHYKEYKSAFAEVENVERTESDNVRVTFRHRRFGSDSFTLSPDSVELVNLLAYHSLDSPKDLVGERVLIDPDSFGSWSTKVLIPHNVAWTGKIRFASYSFISEINQKTKWENPSTIGQDPVDSVFLTFFPCAMVSLAGMALADVLPFASVLFLPIVLWLVGLAGIIGFGLLRICIMLVKDVLESDFEEV